MRSHLVAALSTGFVVAFAIGVLPAFAANQTVAVGDDSWSPANVSIQAGESVTWTNNNGAHNVCVRAAGAGSGCDEYRSGAVVEGWPSGGYSHPFASAGTYHYVCEAHSGMRGTVTVTAAASPSPAPTDTAPAPQQTQPGTVASDTAAPSFRGKLKRASREALVVELSSSEHALLTAIVHRRARGARAFSRIGQTSLQVKQGKNVVTLPRKARGSLRSGAYRLKLQLTDAAGNRSAVRMIGFKLT
jgi:plastocyanin